MMSDPRLRDYLQHSSEYEIDIHHKNGVHKILKKIDEKNKIDGLKVEFVMIDDFPDNASKKSNDELEKILEESMLKIKSRFKK